MTATTRRSFLATIAAAVPSLAVTTPARAWTGVPAQDFGMGSPTGAWAVLDHVTDGTDPSTAIIAPPRFTADIEKMAGTEITLSGYLQPVSGGFGKPKDYVLSRTTFHCPYCYTSGRGSLALAELISHAPQDAQKKVTVRGTLVLQDKDPGDFYFQLKNAKIV